MTTQFPVLPAALLAGGLLSACFNSDEQKTTLSSGETSQTHRIETATNGFGRLLPYVMYPYDPSTGLPGTGAPVEIRTLDDLVLNRPSAANPILPPSTWPDNPINPAGKLANHFVSIQFSRYIFVDSVLDPNSANGLTGAITLVAYDQATGFAEPIQGRAFIDGWTYYGNPPVLEQWVIPDAAAAQNHVLPLPVSRGGVVTQPGIGYPGTDDPVGGAQGIVLDGSFQSAGQFVSPVHFTFVADSDGDLRTYETFPPNRVIRVVIDDSVLDRTGRSLEESGLATSVVGSDVTPPGELLDGIGGNPVTVPLHLAQGVACDVAIQWSFDEAVQPYSVGPLPDAVPPALSSEFVVEFLPPVGQGQPDPGQRGTLPYTALPIGPFNFSEYVLTPAVSFPGTDAYGAAATGFVTYFHNAAEDLFQNDDSTNPGTTEISFTIGQGCPGMANIPVAPGAIYVASNGGGDASGIRVIDLDGFGQGTGDPTHDYITPFYNLLVDQDGNVVGGDIAKFPFNPNLDVSDIFPPLSADTTTLAGGSSGVFTLARNSSLGTQLIDGETIGTVSDMMLGHPLDLVYNNYNCLSGGRNRCAQAAYQVHPMNGGQPYPGNSITHAPHPNPPRLLMSPSCFFPLIQAEQPTNGDANGDGNLATNFLNPGDAFGDLGGFGPSGLLTNSNQYAGFFGPASSNVACPTFTLRQQVGHFLYVLDSANDRIVVVNSNRMNVLDSIPISEPYDLAIAPTLNTLAVSNKGTNTISFIDTDPNSVNFHTIIKTSALYDAVNNRTGLGPSEIVWQPDGEDILVVCENSNSLCILSNADLEVRKIIPGVAQPRFLAVSNRDLAHGFQTGLYYAYVVQENGQIQVFESGPDGNQGIGYDDFIGSVTQDGASGFPGASTIQPDPNSAVHAAYLGYSKNGVGTVAKIFLKSAPTGPRPITLSTFLPDPNFRAKEFTTQYEWSGVFSSASIVDLAVDDLSNSGGMADSTSLYAGAITINHSGKGMRRPVPGGTIPVSEPQFLFAANANGWVDVINLANGTPFVDPIPVPGSRVLCHYWRQ